MLVKRIPGSLAVRRLIVRVLAAMGAVYCLSGTGLSARQPGPPTNLRIEPGDVAPGVTLRDIDGGPHYFARWPNSLPTDAGFFPLAVWFESVVDPRDVDLDQAVGLNTYVVLSDNSDSGLVLSRRMQYFAHHDWVTRPASQLAAVKGWELDDEVDMRFAPTAGFERLRRIKAGVPPDGRLHYANYGKGVTFWLNDSDAGRFVNEFPHVVSADNYWFTDNNICSMAEGGRLVARPPRALAAAECHLAANYGLTVDRLRHLDAMDGSRKPAWAFVEVGHPFTEDHWPSITPGQVRAAVWHSLIAGARGVIYFNHSFGGPCQTQHALREPCYAAVREVVQTTNRQITQLAPVLNSPFADGYVAASSGVRVMAKRGPDGAWYVFAGSRRPGPQDATFTIAAGASVEVLYEGRVRPVSARQFTDSFEDGDTVHIYRISG